MRSRLFWKFFALQLLAALVLVVGALVVMRAQTAHNFTDHVRAELLARMNDVAQRLAQRVSEDGVPLARAAEELRWQARFESPPERRPGDARMGDQPPPPRALLTVIDSAGRILDGPPPRPSAELLRVPIAAGGTVIGYVLHPPPPDWTNFGDDGFSREQTRGALMVAMAAVPLAAVFAALISVMILRPIRRLSAGAEALTQRRFATRLPAHGGDELGKLAADFNRLAEALEQYDHRQRQWLADIAHELRTPLAVMRGELEALLDGVRKPDAGTVQSLHQEALRIGALVEDLHLLSLAESGGLVLHCEALDLGAVLTATEQRYAMRFRDAGFTLQTVVPAEPLWIDADVQRIEQVLGNLLENVLRHAAAPGSVKLQASADANAVHCSVCDSGPGVAPEALPRLFDRLYRADSARGREQGGAGLGLAICRSIVEAHGGTLTARASDAGGLCIEMTLPRGASV